MDDDTITITYAHINKLIAICDEFTAFPGGIFLEPVGGPSSVDYPWRWRVRVYLVEEPRLIPIDGLSHDLDNALKELREEVSKADSEEPHRELLVQIHTSAREHTAMLLEEGDVRSLATFLRKVDKSR